MKYVLVGLGVMLFSTSALAEEKQAITLRPTTVVGNPQRPLVSIEVSKARMRLGPSTPTLAAGAKVDASARKDPF